MNRVWRSQLIPPDRKKVTSQGPEIHEVGDILQVSGRDIEDPQNWPKWKCQVKEW